MRGVRLKSVGPEKLPVGPVAAVSFRKTLLKIILREQSGLVSSLLPSQLRRRPCVPGRWMEKQWPQLQVKGIVSCGLIMVIFWGTLLEGTSLKR